jgi:hypothetical protein
MHHEEASAAHDMTSSKSEQGVQRLELLGWCFSPAEIERLSKLQQRYRERPETVELPLEECRWSFARWLVEHGRIGEGDGVECSSRPPGDDSDTHRSLEAEPTAQLDGPRPPENADHKAWHVRLFGHFARAWRHVVGASEPGSEVAYHRYATDEHAPWYPDLRDPSSRPYSRTMAQMLWLGYPPFY